MIGAAASGSTKAAASSPQAGVAGCGGSDDGGAGTFAALLAGDAPTDAAGAAQAPAVRADDTAAPVAVDAPADPVAALLALIAPAVPPPVDAAAGAAAADASPADAAVATGAQAAPPAASVLAAAALDGTRDALVQTRPPEGRLGNELSGQPQAEQGEKPGAPSDLPSALESNFDATHSGMGGRFVEVPGTFAVTRSPANGEITLATKSGKGISEPSCRTAIEDDAPPLEDSSAVLAVVRADVEARDPLEPAEQSPVMFGARDSTPAQRAPVASGAWVTEGRSGILEMRVASHAAPLAGPAEGAPVPLDDGLGDAVAAQLSWQATQRVGRAEIRLSPPELGAIRIDLRIDGNEVHVDFHSGHAEVRHALEAGLPQLREQLGAQGLQLVQADVAGQRDDAGRAPARDAARGDGPAAGDASDDGGDVAAPVARRSGLLDEFA